MRETNPNTYLVGEVWDKPEVVAPYYQSLDSTFNFDLAEKIVNSVKKTALIKGWPQQLLPRMQCLNHTTQIKLMGYS
ncbi:hypothetical protein GCM10020331_099050 [Ectobacillus funiculus]